MTSASVNELAYTKLMLHCAQYPHCAVDGLCVGTSTGGSIEIVDVVPLFHNGTLTPMLEAASKAAEVYATSKGASVVGYYAANEHLRDESIALCAGPVAEEIAAHNGSAIVIQVSNKRLADPADNGLSAFGKGSDGQWNVTAKVTCAPSSKFLSALDAGVGVHDFDTHLDDVSKDWRNGHVATWLEAN